MKKVVTIGGGTGQYTLLTGLKKFPIEITAIVSMADDGGSTGVLRDELGVLPPGDVRQCLVALSESEEVMRKLFNYRYDQEGGLKGHNFGNLFLSTLEKISGSHEDAVRVASEVLAVRGEVVPVTLTDTKLVCGHGLEVRRGQHLIDSTVISDRFSLRLEPAAAANPKAVKAIHEADCIVIGPGDLYTSIIPNLLVAGVSDAIRNSKATIVYNCNLMTKYGHTDGYGVIDFVDEIRRFVGARVDYVTCNNEKPSDEMARRYAHEGVPVTFSGEDIGTRVLAGDFISKTVVVPKSGDVLRRSYIRHDSERLAKVIVDNCL